MLLTDSYITTKANNIIKLIARLTHRPTANPTRYKNANK